MSKIAVEIDSLSGYSDESDKISASIGDIEASLSILVRNLDWDIVSASGIQYAASQISKNILLCENSTKKLATFLRKAQSEYAKLDSEFYEMENENSEFGSSSSTSSSILNLLSIFFPWLDDVIGGNFLSEVSENLIKYLSTFTYYITGGLFTNNAVLSGEIGASLGIFSASAYGKILTGEATSGGKAEWDLKEGDAYAEAYAKAEGSLLEFGSEGKIGDFLKFTDTNSVGNVGAVGAIGASLFVNNQFSPQIYAKAEVEASVFEKEMKIQFGSDENNEFMKVKAEVLSAEAKANIGVGMVTQENIATGEVTQYFGVQAEAGAGAYVGKVTATKGYTIFGIEIGASVGVNYGGAEAKVGGSVTTGGISGSLGLGFGVGGDVKITVDWSKCTLFNYFK